MLALLLMPGNTFMHEAEFRVTMVHIRATSHIRAAARQAQTVH